MAVTDRDSTGITNLNASPKVRNNSNREGAGVLREIVGYVANAADDDGTSVHRFCRVPSNARISSVSLTTADASSAGNIDVGLYDTDDDGVGAAVDVDLFASAFALTGGDFVNTELVAESGEITTLERISPLWEILGLTTDPNKEYDVAVTITTTYNGAGVGQLLRVLYTI